MDDKIRFTPNKKFTVMFSMDNDTISHFKSYAYQLSNLLASFDWAPVNDLARELYDCWKSGRQVFIAGNGGSGGNANHIANDYVYPVSKILGSGIRMHSLVENTSVLTCLANDEGYDSIFSHQLSVMGRDKDILIVLSGSGNSKNIIKALQQAKLMKIKSYAVLGFSGGEAKFLADVSIHFPIHDMQIAEDCQIILFHMIMQWLYSQRISISTGDWS